MAVSEGDSFKSVTREATQSTSQIKSATSTRPSNLKPVQVARPGSTPQPAIIQPPSSVSQVRAPAKGYTADQIKKIWTDAGGDPRRADMAAAVAMATSAGNPSASKMGRRKQTGGLWGGTGATAKDPLASARAAIAQSRNGTDWRGFPAASNGAGTFMADDAPARRYLPSGLTDTGAIPAGGNQAPSVSTPAGLTDLGGFDYYIRMAGWVAMVAVGNMLIILGVLLMAVGSRTVKDAVKELGSMIFGGFGFGVGANIAAKAGGAAAAEGNAVTKLAGGGRGGPPPAPALTTGDNPLPISPGEPPTLQLPNLLSAGANVHQPGRGMQAPNYPRQANVGQGITALIPQGNVVTSGPRHSAPESAATRMPLDEALRIGKHRRDG